MSRMLQFPFVNHLQFLYCNKDITKLSERLSQDLTQKATCAERFEGEPYMMGKQLWIRAIACGALDGFDPVKQCALLFKDTASHLH